MVPPVFSAKACATASSSVDLPTPGSPATSTTWPGTRPPPMTRSNSPAPVEVRVRRSPAMSPTGVAGFTRAACAVALAGAAACSTTVPNSWHLGHRPTHLNDVAPQAVQA